MLPPESTFIEGNSERQLHRFCNALSYVFHPFALPVYAVLILLLGDTLLSPMMQMNVKWYVFSVVVLTTVVIPVGFIILMRILDVLPDYSLAARRERITPLIILLLSYILCIVMLRSGGGVLFLVNKFLFAAAGCVLAALAITFFWQISLHMIAIGGLLAMLTLVNVSQLGNLFVANIAFILVAGALGTARLYLGKHSPAQVWAGFLVGFTVASLVILNIG